MTSLSPSSLPPRRPRHSPTFVLCTEQTASPCHSCRLGVSGVRQSAFLPQQVALAPAADTCAFSQQQQGNDHLLVTPAAVSPTQLRRISRLRSASRPVTLIAAFAVVEATKHLPPIHRRSFPTPAQQSLTPTLLHANFVPFANHAARTDFNT